MPISTLYTWTSHKKLNGNLTDRRINNQRPLDIELDKQLMVYFTELRSKNLPVTGKLLKFKALAIKDGTNFSASNGWLTKFLKRIRITNRKRTHIMQKLRDNFSDEIIKYFYEIEKLQKTYGDKLVFVNFDESPFYYDLCRDKTLHYKGEKEVKAIASNGEILDILVIFYYAYKNKATGTNRNFPKFNVSPIMVRFNSSGYNNEILQNEWFDKLFVRFFCKHKDKHVVLLLDDASFHSNETLKKKCQDNKITLLIIPGGTTSFLQPLDVSINKPLKDLMRELYIPWLMEQCSLELKESTTKSGYLKAPGNEKIIEWISKSKKQIKPEMIIKLFEKTGITCDKERSFILERRTDFIESMITG